MGDEEKQLKQKPVTVDLNDLTLADEQVEVNPEGDAFGFPPPPDDATYLAKLKLGDQKVQLGTDKNGHPYYMLHIEARIISDGKFNDAPVFDRASTTVFQSSGTCRLAGVLKALGHPVPRQTSIREMAKLGADVLAGEPQSRITTQWEAYCTDCDKRVLRGQRRFQAGKHTVECPKCGGSVSAQARIVEYAPV